MNIKIINLYPTEEAKTKKIENEKCQWYLSRIRDKYSEEMIRLAIEMILQEESEQVQ